jgi:hypothetical protein
MDEYSAALASAVEAALPGWVRRCVIARLTAAGGITTPEAEELIAEAQSEALLTTMPELRAFLELDVDQQRTNPLAVLRRAVRFPTGVLAQLGVPPIRRSEFDRETFPDDVYGLSPATWSDIDESVHDPGLFWGAWKAKTVLDRRRDEGRR